MRITKPSQFLAALEMGPYAWPGGYPCYFVMAGGEALSFAAAQTEHRRIVENMLSALGRPSSSEPDWIPIAYEINWDESLRCIHTNEPIPSAYGDDTEGDTDA